MSLLVHVCLARVACVPKQSMVCELYLPAFACRFVVRHYKASGDFSGASHAWRSLLQGTARQWVQDSQMLALLSQERAGLPLTEMHEACRQVLART